jgi:sugar phosphate isomerase/epimerase
MARIPIALQLYSVREACAEDLPGTLKAVADMGYDGVDFAGYYDYSAKELRTMLDDLGLKVAGTHIRIDTLLGQQLEATVAFEQELGNKFLIVPGLSEEYRSSHDAWRRTAEVFNEISQRLEPFGMYTGYHNHFIEFEEIDGETAWDVFAKNTDPRVVLQMDTGNCMHGGGDPLAYIGRYPGRSLTVHLKEWAKGYDKALIGEGDTDWHRLFELCETIGDTEWYIVEQESYAHPPLECVRRCIDNLRAMGK